jgi:hypothetical protein
MLKPFIYYGSRHNPRLSINFVYNLNTNSDTLILKERKKLEEKI